ncbi:MAG: nucleotide exchange factor GrpE [Eggerthellaceae bacterium]
MENSESKDLEQNAQTEEAPTEAEAVDEQPADDKLAAELAQVKDQLLRTMAEYDNHRKRTAKEKLELRADIISNVVSDFLPVMDNLERALQADCTDEKYKQGVQMIYDSFMETLKKLGVTEIESEVLTAASPGCAEVDGTALSGRSQTFAKGYKINDKVIRFAMVAVAN